MKPEHTFVIPAYGESPYLESCIEALRAQSVRSDIKIATSTPSEFIYKTAYRFNIPVAVNRKGGGIAADWTFACRCCDTRYLTLAHQDDIYLPDYSKRCLEGLAKSTNSLIAFTDYEEVFEDRIRTNTALLNIKRAILFPFFLFTDSIGSKIAKKAILATGSAICCPSVMFDKESVGEIVFNPKMSINMDWHFWFNLSEKEGSFHYISEKLVQHRIHEDSETTKGLNSNRRQNEDLYMFEKIWPSPIAGLLARLYTLSYLSNNR